MSGIRAHIAGRLRSSSLNLSTVPPRPESQDYSSELARHAASILFLSPLPSEDHRPVYILNAAALPDSREENFDSLLPYVLARLPEEDELLKGFEYEVVFFAGDSDGTTSTKRNRPGWGWFLQAYHVLSRAMRKRLQKLYIVHEKAWVRILTEIFSTIVSPKFRRKIIHASSLTQLATYITIENLLIPPSTYLNDRRVSDNIAVPRSSGRRAFTAPKALPTNIHGQTRLPRVLRETTSFLLLEENIVSEGLFRVPPHSKLRDVLKEAYDRGQKYIIWKDNGVVQQPPPYIHAEHVDSILAEIDPRDAYSVFMAAALIKAWYSSLRQPIFPQSSYTELKRLHGNPAQLPDLHQLSELFSPTSDWSFLPSISREILVRHLLPLFSAVAQREDRNKMSAENLAVCIAPALLCGPDQLEDAKMSSIIRRILTQAVEAWPKGLSEACGRTNAAFLHDLELPSNPNDWEDPLEGHITLEDLHIGDETHSTGIVLLDNDSPVQQTRMESPPALPPRPNAPTTRAQGDIPTKRKPAPPLQMPHGARTFLSEGPQNSTQSPIAYSPSTDGIVSHRNDSGAASHLPTTAESKRQHPGTNHVLSPISASATPELPPLVLPKRKALTPSQIDNAEQADVLVQARQASRELDRQAAQAMLSSDQAARAQGIALPGLVSPTVQQSSLPAQVKRKAVASSSYTPDDVSAPKLSPVESPSASAPSEAFRRPSWPASATRTPTIASLARPVPPALPATNGPPVRSSTLPVSGPKPRTPSPALLQRMPSFESTAPAPKLERTVTPRRLNMKQQSVDDLRRLYEERVGTATALVQAGRMK